MRMTWIVPFSLLGLGPGAEGSGGNTLAPRLQPEDLLVLEPGYWHGKQIRLPLFAEEPDRPEGPTCIQAELSFHDVGGKPVARLRVRAERPPPPPPVAPPSEEHTSRTGTPSASLAPGHVTSGASFWPSR